MESKKIPTTDSITFGTDHPKEVIIIKALTDAEWKAVKLLIQFERNLSMEEAIKIVLLEKEPEIAFLNSIAADYKRNWKQEKATNKIAKFCLKYSPYILGITFGLGVYAGYQAGIP